MQHRIIIALFLILASFPALACAPPNDDPTLSDAQIARSTKDYIQRSDAIIDALVIQKKEGIFLLKPLKIWKGKPQRFYYVANGGCGITLINGSKVRVLLENESFGWIIVPPLLDHKFRTRLFDSILDAHLGHVRSRGFENGSLPYPPAL